jgi:hypothetical protein
MWSPCLLAAVFVPTSVLSLLYLYMYACIW